VGSLLCGNLEEELEEILDTELDPGLTLFLRRRSVRVKSKGCGGRASAPWSCLPREDDQSEEAEVAVACASLSRIRNERFSGVIAILSSRASHPMAHSKIGGFPFVAFLSCEATTRLWC
jgi:hypothetical protein